jgi:hypothetical protein
LQTPAPLQVSAPAHSLSGSVLAAMLPQVPSEPEPFFAAVHAWQVPPHALLQQTKSTHCPLEHSPLIEHASPFAKSAQIAPLQLVAPGHSLSGSVLTATLPQVPSEPEPFFAAVHDWHRPLHALLQQTPSTH